MSLINSASNDNRIIEEGKNVTYSKQKVQQSYVMVEGPVQTTYYFVWEYRRFCTASVKWVGMSYSGAISWQNTLISSYTRSYKVSDWRPYTGDFVRISGGKRLMADVSVVKTVGHLYEVHLTINEEDTILMKTGTSSPASLFASENARTYTGL